MLDLALKFLVKELNVFLKSRTGSDEVFAELSRLVGDDGKWSIGENRIGFSLASIEEERTLKAQRPEQVLIDGQQVLLEPTLRLNLHFLVAARFQQYEQALHFLGHVLTFFQAHPQFQIDRYPSLDPRIRKLTLELLNLNYEQLNQLWAFLGAKYLPSAVYRLRLVALQDQEPAGLRPPVSAMSAKIEHL